MQPPEGQYSIGWTIEYEYHFIEYEYEICPGMWEMTREVSPGLLKNSTFVEFCRKRPMASGIFIEIEHDGNPLPTN